MKKSSFKFEVKIPSAWKTLIEDYTDTTWWKYFQTISNNETLFSNLKLIEPNNVRVIMLSDIFYNDLKVSSQAMKQFVHELCNQMEFTHSTTVQESAILSRLSNEGVLYLNTSAYSLAENDRIHYRMLVAALLNRLIEKNKNIITIAFGGSNIQLINEISKTTTYSINNIITVGHPSPRATTSNFVGSNCFREVNNKLIEKGMFPIRYHIIF